MRMELMTHCPSCNADYATDLTECPACAEANAPVVQCAHCGQEYQGADACPACGRFVAEHGCDTHAASPAVGRCVLCGEAVCSECGHEETRLILCAEHREVPVIEGWAQVYSTTSEFEAQLLRENMHAEGLGAQVYSQKDSAFNVDLGELSIVRLLVPVWEYGHALQVIRDHMDASGEVAFACSSCGEAFETGARECTACGAALV